MAKLFTYLVVLYGLLALFALAGMPTVIFDMTTWMGAVATFALLGIGTGIAVSILTKTSPDIYIAATFAISSLIPLAIGFTSIISYAATFGGWISYAVGIVFGVLSIGYGVSIIDWVSNRGGN